MLSDNKYRVNNINFCTTEHLHMTKVLNINSVFEEHNYFIELNKLWSLNKRKQERFYLNS